MSAAAFKQLKDFHRSMDSQIMGRDTPVKRKLQATVALIEAAERFYLGKTESRELEWEIVKSLATLETPR